ncbi:uncharacterized protein LOC129923367 [Biomphalaria glabrata]|uniref:Uncharacterized protein LOC129923367 n=1 Tax=Biomphalaria glabrata TaxID=6526 RepID=A0A9W2Z4Q0_BIOGL|nr:uncharacterized protein LOC129923367 [Biomphalaria glabrata]
MCRLVTLSLCCLLVNSYFCSGTVVVLEANPKVIHPVVTKKFHLRCSVKKDNWQPSNLTSTQGREVSEVANFNHLMSIVITEGQRETIASVTGCDPPVVEPSFTRLLHAVGNANHSKEPDEMGYLLLTWDRPLAEDADNFTCQAYALDGDKFPVSLNVSLEVTAIEPTMSDLTRYIALNDRHIESLEKQLTKTHKTIDSDMKEIKSETNKLISAMDLKLDQIPVYNIQTGSFKCEQKSIQFRQPFEYTPRVFTSSETYNWQNYNNRYDISISVLHTNNTGFTVNCRSDQDSNRFINWLAIE